MRYIKEYNEYIDSGNIISLSTDLSKLSFEDKISAILNFFNKSDIPFEHRLILKKLCQFTFKTNNGELVRLNVEEINKECSLIIYYRNICSEINTIMDLIKFISEHMSILISSPIFNKLNENNSTEKEEVIIRKFISYLTNLDEWEETNRAMYKMKQNWVTVDSSFDDLNYHSYNLYNINDIVGDGKLLDLPHDDMYHITYFIVGLYEDKHGTQTDFHIYKNNQFTKATDEEDDYLRDLDDEIYLVEQDCILSITFDDWVENNKLSADMILKINEKNI